MGERESERARERGREKEVEFDTRLRCKEKGTVPSYFHVFTLSPKAYAVGSLLTQELCCSAMEASNGWIHVADRVDT